ncbi:hypothetical protein GCM10023066_12820 [Nocardioides kongjuensis]
MQVRPGFSEERPGLTGSGQHTYDTPTAASLIVASNVRVVFAVTLITPQVLATGTNVVSSRLPGGGLAAPTAI